MSIRGDKTHGLILQRSRSLFARAGFSEITMKDIAEECEISRGGLYRHFSSTGEIFAEIIKNEQEHALEVLNVARSNGVPAERIFTTFLTKQIKSATDKTQWIDNAISEFAANDPRGNEIIVNRALASVKIMTDMIEAGIAEKAFRCENAEGVARHILWIIEGMAKHNALIPLEDVDIEAQMQIIYSLLGRNGLEKEL